VAINRNLRLPVSMLVQHMIHLVCLMCVETGTERFTIFVSNFLDTQEGGIHIES
jgi:hypothetical protein